MKQLRAIPELPEKNFGSAISSTATKIATPDLIEIREEELPQEVINDLLFESMSSIEIINIGRNDIINGQNISYNIIGNTDAIQKLFNSDNMFKISGSSKEFFDNFGIRFGPHVPENGTAPPPAYISPIIAEPPTTNVQIIDRISGDVITTLSSFEAGQIYIDQNYPIRDLVYVDQNTGNLVVDVTNMRTNESVDVEVQLSGSTQDDTIY